MAISLRVNVVPVHCLLCVPSGLQLVGKTCLRAAWRKIVTFWSVELTKNREEKRAVYQTL